VPTLADACIVDIVGADESLDRVAVAHRDAAKTALLQAKPSAIRRPTSPSGCTTPICTSRASTCPT
jgi:hypothetical protein